MLTSMILLRRRRHIRWSARQIDIDSPFIRLRQILQPQLLTDLLNSRFNLLDMTRTVVPFADDDMKMCLTVLFSVSDPLF